MIKGIFFIGFGLLIDGLQAAVAWMFVSIGAGLQAITPLGGAAAGAVAGCAAGTGVSGCIQGGLAGAAAGAVVSALGVPLGVGLAFVSTVCIGITMGGGLILALSMFGMYYPGYMLPVFVGETLPGLDILPGWTFLAVMCVLKKNASENSGVVGLASMVATAALSPSSATGGFGKATAAVMNAKARTRSLVQNARDTQSPDESEQGQKIAPQRQQLVTDVGREIQRQKSLPPRAANDNMLQPSYAKAA